MKSVKSKRLSFVIILLIILSFFSVDSVFADVFIPSPPDDCKDNEIYFKEGNINPNDYIKIRSVVFSNYAFTENGLIERKSQEGFCVDREEYCSKNNCDLKNTAEIFLQQQIFSPLFHIKSILLNLVLNSIIILVIYFISKTNLKGFYTVSSLIKIFIITILGYFYDYLAIFLDSVVSKLINTPYSKYRLAELITEAIPLGTLVIVVFILVSSTFYFLYSKTITTDKKKRLVYSCIFGILSNPLWYILYKTLFSSSL